jgi:hypothetical protein
LISRATVAVWKYLESPRPKASIGRAAVGYSCALIGRATVAGVFVVVVVVVVVFIVVVGVVA